MSATEQTQQEAGEPVSVTRYNPATERIELSSMSIDIGGEYVRYQDFLAAKLNPSGFVLTKDDPAVYRMMQAILDITGDCEQSKTFSGWQLQAVQNKSSGEFVKIELIATDKIGDVVAPRV